MYGGQVVVLAFSQDDMDDAFDIFTKNPQVAETYAAILDASAHTCYHQQNKTYLIPLITSYSLLKPLILGVRRG